MTPHDQAHFFELMGGICELYGKVASPQFMAIYWSALQQYELADIRRAFNAHALNPDTGQFMPKPADVVRYVDGGSQTRAAKAWAKVDKAMRCVGGGDSVVFDDPLIHAALDGLGSWPELCATPVDELTFLQGRFEKRYQAMVFTPPAEWPKVLTGAFEVANAGAGQRIAPPIPIGDTAKCRLTYSGGVEPSAMLRLQPAAQLALKQIQGVQAANERQGRAA
ncbi:DUF6475 domain-containing protein [Chitinilyticum litopenaei]|uniref:DUF6475 domain-containing protein n=1 Tax=Chitinilyticum litopenaei TaxID=1121276 RepID=UPI0004174A8B|nr:DUF6475 domain-containing protein [Chitinilyticum litopenaei]